METVHSSLFPIASSKPTATRQRFVVTVLATLAFLLSGMPKLHVSIGAPLYAVDIIILYLLFRSRNRFHFKFRGYPQLIARLLLCYLLFVILGELNGGFVYNRPFESTYILFRSCLAVSIAYIIPGQIRTLSELRTILQGVMAGLVLSSAIAVLYSVPSTRDITETLFSIKMLAPNSDAIVDQSNAYYDQVFAGSYRGLTLLGASTFSSGIMATLWPMLFIGFATSFFKGVWKHLHRLAMFLVPLGILATYGRSAWLSVVLVAISILLWGSQRGRLKLILSFLLVGLLISQVSIAPITSKLPLVNRVISKTQLTVESGAATESEAERFLAYVEPFSHVIRHPSFLFMGTGAAQRRWSGNAFEEADTASHAIPGMAYYAYGVGGAVCQIGLFSLAFLTIYRRLRQAQRYLPGTTWMWRSLLACWFGLLPWWCFGHGIVTAPRGAMVFFFFIGIVLACDQIFTHLGMQSELFRTESQPGGFVETV